MSRPVSGANASIKRSKKRKKKPKKVCTPAQLKKRAKVKRSNKRSKRKKSLPNCRPKKVVKKPGSGPLTPAGNMPAPAGSGVVPPPPSPPMPPPSWAVDSPIAKYAGEFGIAQAERLLWRAGFGPRRGEAAQLAGLGLEQAVTRFTRPSGPATLTGPEPTHSDGQPISPLDIGGDDHVYWLDRMVRSDQQLVERMALVFHDWFATSLDVIGLSEYMLEQTNLFRQHGLGSFKELVRGITLNRAMIYYLSSHDNLKGRINENYARELMELFTLGAGTGAYTEQDVREAARALSGFKPTYAPSNYPAYFTFTPALHDDGVKTVFGQTGQFDWADISRMVVEHPKHPAFFVNKLWSYFVPESPPDDVRVKLEERYVASGYQIRPVVEAILCSPQFYNGPRMVKSPVVYNAGMLRARGRHVFRADWYWYSMMAGQRLYWPPDVSGWNDKRWLNTSTLRARWSMACQVFLGETINYLDQPKYDAAESPELAVERALEFWGNPWMSPESIEELVAFAEKYTGSSLVHARRQNTLRQIIPCTPDYLTS